MALPSCGGAWPRSETLAILISATALPQAERAMQGDFGALLWILLLGQGLVAAALAVTWARYRWGRWQVWLAGGPLLLALALSLSNAAAQLLPNLL